MTRLSKRFQRPILACLALCTVAGWTLLLGASRLETCRDPDAIHRAPGFEGARRTSGVVRDGVFESTIHRLAPPASAVPLQLRVVRSDRPFSLFGNWVAMITPPMDAVEAKSISLQVDGKTIPIHEVRAAAEGATHVAAALFVYDGRPIHSLLAAQLDNTWRQLFRGTFPLTMYAADGSAPTGQEDHVTTAAQAWLAEAWKQHREVCGL